MGIRILPSARARIIEIWNYTEAKWGEQQADTYVRELIEAIKRRGATRERWRPVQDPELVGVYFMKYEHHFIFFKSLTGGVVGVITILHETMDIPARVKQDVD